MGLTNSVDEGWTDKVGSAEGEAERAEEKIERLVDWNVALFEDLLGEIVAKRQQMQGSSSNSKSDCMDQEFQAISIRKEAARTICMPHYESAGLEKKASEVDLKAPLTIWTHCRRTDSNQSSSN